MRELKQANEIEGVVCGKKPKTTIPDKMLPCPLDKVNRQFHASAPNVLWVSGGTDYGAPSGGKNGFFSGSNSYGNSSFDSGPKPGFSNPTNVSSPSTGEKVYDKGVYDLEGPEATGAGTYVQMRLAEGLPISRGTAA